MQHSAQITRTSRCSNIGRPSRRCRRRGVASSSTPTPAHRFRSRRRRPSSTRARSRPTAAICSARADETGALVRVDLDAQQIDSTVRGPKHTGNAAITADGKSLLLFSSPAKTYVAFDLATMTAQEQKLPSGLVAASFGIIEPAAISGDDGGSDAGRRSVEHAQERHADLAPDHAVGGSNRCLDVNASSDGPSARTFAKPSLASIFDARPFAARGIHHIASA